MVRAYETKKNGLPLNRNGYDMRKKRFRWRKRRFADIGMNNMEYAESEDLDIEKRDEGICRKSKKIMKMINAFKKATGRL